MSETIAIGLLILLDVTAVFATAVLTYRYGKNFIGGAIGGVLLELVRIGIAFAINQIGSMISLHFGGHPVVDFASAASANIEVFKKYFHAMLDRGIYLPPSAFESWFLNNALSREDLDRTIHATAQSLSLIGK